MNGRQSTAPSSFIMNFIARLMGKYGLYLMPLRLGDGRVGCGVFLSSLAFLSGCIARGRCMCDINIAQKKVPAKAIFRGFARSVSTTADRAKERIIMIMGKERYAVFSCMQLADT